MKIGYTRVSTSQQQDSLKVQEQALKSYGCEKIFTDQISGVRTDRPGLEAALAYARENDSIVVTRLDRLGRSTVDVLRTVQELTSRGITIEALDTKLDTRAPVEAWRTLAPKGVLVAVLLSSPKTNSKQRCALSTTV